MKDGSQTGNSWELNFHKAAVRERPQLAQNRVLMFFK